MQRSGITSEPHRQCKVWIHADLGCLVFDQQITPANIDRLWRNIKTKTAPVTMMATGAE